MHDKSYCNSNTVSCGCDTFNIHNVVPSENWNCIGSARLCNSQTLDLTAPLLHFAYSTAKMEVSSVSNCKVRRSLLPEIHPS